MAENKGIVANSALNAAAGMLLLVTGFVCSIITARLLGPEANGIIAFALWLATTGSLVAELGTGVLLLRMLPQLRAEGHDERRRIGFAALLATPTLISTLILAALYGATVVVSEEMHWAETAPSVALVTGILFVVQSIGAFAKNFLIGEQRLSTFFRLTALASLLQLLGVAVGAVVHGVEGALIGYAAAQLVNFVFTLRILVARRDACGIPLKTLATSAVVVSASYIIESIFLNRIELLFLQQFWSVAHVGYYAVALSVANLALQLPIQLTGSLLPFYAARRAESEDGRLPIPVFAGVIRAIAYITLPMAFGLAAISETLVTLIFGPDFIHSGRIVAVLALAAPPYILMQVLTQYLFSIDKTRERLVVGVFGSFAIVIGCFALVPAFGGEGAAVARLIAFIAMAVLMIRLTGFAHALGELFSVLWRIVLASATCAAAALLVLWLVGSGVISLILAIIAGGIAYLAALTLFRAVPGEDGALMMKIAGRLPKRFARPARSIIMLLSPEIAKVSQEEARGAGRAAAIPVSFSGTLGLYQPADPSVAPADTAVLILSPWGFEEMCTRKFHRLTAEALAERGIASFRFDYPGTGDSLDLPDEAETLELWEEAALAAAEKLRDLSGRSSLVLMGHGFGAAMAQRLSGRIGHVSGLVLLAPVSNGRAYLREQAIWSKMVDAGLGLRDDQRPAGDLVIAGLTMPKAIHDAIKAMNLAREPGAGAPRVLILERAQKMADRSIADALAERGATVEQETYLGHDDLVSNPTIAIQPYAVIERVADWTKTLSGEAAAASPPAPADRAEPLDGADGEEIALRFGAGRHLFGVLTLPKAPRTGRPVVILGTAYDRHAGWGRMGVQLARRLARAGVPSLRYDAANVGDSVPVHGAPDQVLYSETQSADVSDAIGLLTAHAGEPVVLAGRCSGGYQAFQGALTDERVAGLLSINPYTLQWDPGMDVAEGLRFQPRSLDDYSQRLVNRDTFKRLISGDIDIPAATRNIVVAIARKIGQRLGPLIEMLPGHVGPQVRDKLDQLEARGLPVTLIYSDGDVGLEHIHLIFGKDGRKLERWKNVRFVRIPDADHNLTPPHARETSVSELEALIARLS